MGTKYDVFISYSRKDTVVADRICAALDQQDITYFIDRKGIGDRISTYYGSLSKQAFWKI